MTLWTWSKAETIRFIDIYKSHPHLWHKNSDLYSNKAARALAYQSIIDSMKCDTMTSKYHVKQKLKSIKCMFIQERKNIARSERKEGEAYIPLPWYYNFKEIMDVKMAEYDIKQEVISDSDDNEDPSTSTDCQTNTKNVIKKGVSQDDDDDDIICIESPPAKKPKNNIAINKNAPRACFVENANAPKEPKKKKALERNVFTMQKIEVTNDEFQMFATNIAAQLRTLPLDVALNLQTEIHKLIAKERMELYRQRINRTSQKEDVDVSNGENNV